MVEFKVTPGGYDVVVNEKLFGRLQKGDGFFTDSTVVTGFLRVSPNDLEEIAKKARETMSCAIRRS